MKCLKKVLVSALISASVCSTVTRAMPAAGWVGVGVVGLAATVGVPFAVSLACSRKKVENELHVVGPNQPPVIEVKNELYVADPNQPPVTDEKKRQAICDFFDKYFKKQQGDGQYVAGVYVDDAIKGKIVEVASCSLDGKKYEKMEMDQAESMKVLSYAFSLWINDSYKKQKVSRDGFNYGLSFGSAMASFYKVFISDNCKFIRVTYVNGFQAYSEYCVTLKID